MRCAKIKLTDKKDGDKRTVPLSLDLVATIGVTFNDYGMYYAFKSQWTKDGRWSFHDCQRLAIFHFK